ncbi:GNAT acetyltransferase 2-domain-containing protein [Xylariaceae sp. FL0016]|nr:GNAT acetyltransferase 2-domain-containing protein [Xylariaceae sp. FL0016]
MSRKQVDSRIPTLIRNCQQTNHRGVFVVVGDQCKDVIVKLHYIKQSSDLKGNKSVLWAYQKKLLGFTSHRKKREQKIKKDVRRGIREPNAEDAFELFVSSQDVRYTYYKETEKILGNTYGMVVLQDFEGLTPNIMARTIETIQGGGLLILLLKGLTSLKQLYTLTMDAHARFRTEAYQDVVPRFNERFLLSLGKCSNCLIIDDELNVLPISGGKDIMALPPPDLDEPKTESQVELESMKDSLRDTRPVGQLVSLAKTVDQAKALLTFVDAIVEKTLRSTVTLTAARGRGKSAALGVAIAAAVAHGYSNIFITSPSPENLKTLFQFIFKGFDALGYADNSDYSIIQSTNVEFNKAIVRVNVHTANGHRQTIQYIRPQDAHVLGQAELLVIDEAAAIPLPVVRKLMGPYLVFMASTINGYEGTGRSLSLKLIKQLRDQSRAGAVPSTTEVVDRSSGKGSKVREESHQGGRSLREITLEEPIRYASGDAVESWLTNLLCLNATERVSRSKWSIGYPDPETCQLLKVNRDTLFSGHAVSEKFLQDIVGLYVASHYKNSPDDLMLMADAPSHEIYVLVAPNSESKGLPEPLVVIQVALEGKISRQSVLNSLGRGTRPAGDLIPWLVSEQFQDDTFAGLSGARVVRIATDPNYMRKGYGNKALALLIDFYSGKFASLSEEVEQAEKPIVRVTEAELARSTLQDDIRPREGLKLPPMFAKLSEVKPTSLDYVGVSFGLTQELHRFWKRGGFAPLYLRQTANSLTGEHTCVMLRPLENSDDTTWCGAYTADFKKRFLALLAYEFRHFESVTALSIDEAANSGAQLDPTTISQPLTKEGLDAFFSPFDLKRLESYANNLLDYRVILDLIPPIADLYFKGRLKGEGRLITPVQESILLAVGLQKKTLDVVAEELTIAVSQLLAMFMKTIKKIYTHLESLISGAVEASLPKAQSIGVSIANASGAHDDEKVDTRFAPLETSLEEELEEGGDEALKEVRRKQRELIDSLPLDQYEVEGDAPAWEDAEKQVRIASKRGNSNPVVSVKSSKSKRKAEPTAAEIYEEEFGEKRQKKSKKPKKSH